MGELYTDKEKAVTHDELLRARVVRWLTAGSVFNAAAVARIFLRSKRSDILGVYLLTISLCGGTGCRFYGLTSGVIPTPSEEIQENA